VIGPVYESGRVCQSRGRTFPHTAPDRGVEFSHAGVVEDVKLCVEHVLQS